VKILDRYILKKFLSTFFFTVVILVSVIVIIDITERNDKFIKHGLSLSEILPYYLAFIPFVANLITPITVFIATTFVTAKMASHTEIIAMLSGGVSFRRFMVPYLIGALIIGFISFYFNGWVIPDANKVRVAFEVAYLKRPFYFSETDIHLKVAPKSYAYLRSYNSNIDGGFNFTLETINDNLLVEKLSARRIDWDSTKSVWKLRDWDLRIINDFGETVTFGRELDTTLNINPKDFASSYRLHETFTNDELNDYIELLTLRGDDGIAVYEIEKQVRYMSPFAAIILTFIGVIISARKTRGGSGLQIAIGFLLAFLYIILFIMSRAIADAGSIPPIVGVWLPNIMFSIVGVLMYHTVPR